MTKITSRLTPQPKMRFEQEVTEATERKDIGPLLSQFSPVQEILAALRDFDVLQCRWGTHAIHKR
jgi:hypothetical protein